MTRARGIIVGAELEPISAALPTKRLKIARGIRRVALKRFCFGKEVSVVIVTYNPANDIASRVLRRYLAGQMHYVHGPGLWIEDPEQPATKPKGDGA